MSRGKFVAIQKKRIACPICGHRDWCMISADRTEVLCNRIESDKPVPTGNGWFHRIAEELTGSAPTRTVHRPFRETPQRVINWSRVAELAHLQLDDKREILPHLAERLGVSMESLSWLMVGWSRRSHAFTWPMRDANEKIVGIRLRDRQGKKWSVKGTDGHGLFIPMNLGKAIDAAEKPYELLIAEGPSDVAALFDLGFMAIGRPSCNAGNEYVARFCRQHGPIHAVIVADADGPGRRGAEQLAQHLIGVCPDVRLIEPPGRHNDIREWKRSGASPRALRFAIDSAYPVRRKESAA